MGGRGIDTNKQTTKSSSFEWRGGVGLGWGGGGGKEDVAREGGGLLHPNLHKITLPSQQDKNPTQGTKLQ